MKKILLHFLLPAIASFLLFSCKDVINSDPNIAITREFNYNVKSDQEHGVIMPLKYGNVWIYNLISYDSNVLAIDTSRYVVKASINTLINGENWTRLDTWMYKGMDVNTLPLQMTQYKTNTDMGLFSRLGAWDTIVDPYFEAEYPAKNSRYFAGTDGSKVSNGDNGLDTLQVWVTTENFSSLTVPYGSFSGIKYTRIWENARTHQYYENPFLIDYYVPDLGLVATYKRNSNGQIKPVLELIYTNTFLNGRLVQIMTDFDFGQVSLGAAKVVLLEDILVNNSTDTVRINYISLAPQETDLTIVSPLDLPFALIPGHSLPGIKIKLAATKQGIINQQLVIGTSAGIFYVNIKADRQ